MGDLLQVQGLRLKMADGSPGLDGLFHGLFAGKGGAGKRNVRIGLGQSEDGQENKRGYKKDAQGIHDITLLIYRDSLSPYDNNYTGIQQEIQPE